MDNATLVYVARDIADIKWILGAILFLILIFMIGNVLHFTRVRARSSNINDKLGDLLDKDELQKLIEIASEKIKELPGDPYIRWYLAMAYYRNKDWSKALAEFEKLHEMQPSWREEYIDAYIADIKDKLKHFKPQIVKE